MKKVIVGFCCLAGLLSFLTASAEVYVWTGASDAKWTNKDNWTVNGQPAEKFPGVAYSSGHGHSTGTANLTEEWAAWETESDTAVFDATGAARTTIDLGEFFSISNVVIQGADAPSYTFGTSSTQILPLKSNGEIRIAEEVAADQRIAAVTAAGIGTRGNATEKGFITFRNNSTQGAVLRHFEVAMVRKALGLTAQWVETQVGYYGTGDFEIGGKCRNWSGEPPT